eukprot:1721808-Rhodomonas_salina.1
MVAVTAVATSCKKINGNYFVDCSILTPKPASRHAHVLQFSVGPNSGSEPWNICKHLVALYNNLLSLHDIGLVELAGQPGITLTLAAWMLLTTANTSTNDPLWALRTLTEDDGVHRIGILEPDPKGFKQALLHPFLLPLWMESATEEMDGLFKR